MRNLKQSHCQRSSREPFTFHKSQLFKYHKRDYVHCASQVQRDIIDKRTELRIGQPNTDGEKDLHWNSIDHTSSNADETTNGTSRLNGYVDVRHVMNDFNFLKLECVKLKRHQ